MALKLGDLLLKAKLITQEQLNEALKLQPTVPRWVRARPVEVWREFRRDRGEWRWWA